LRSPCAPRLQVPCSASRVVPGAHRVVGPGTHRGSGPREVHTTPGKNEPGALCRALWEKAHGKGGAVRFRPFAVRRRRTAKSAIPVVYVKHEPSDCHPRVGGSSS
jgi:hypothetical protein